MAPLILNTYSECLYVYSIFSFFQRTLLTFKLFMELLGLPASIFHTVRLGAKQRGSKSKDFYHAVCVTQEAFPSFPWGMETMEWLAFLKPRWENHSQDCHII